MSSSRIVKPRSKTSSTDRRRTLVELIDFFGEDMPTKCAPCREAGRVCRVHVRSGRCGGCNASNNARCDIRITASEFRRLSKERSSLRDKLVLHKEELESARLALNAAHERYMTALAKQTRLLASLEQNERRADEAVAVEERGLREQESEELDLPSFDPFPWDDRLLLSPSQWEKFLHLPVSASVAGPSVTL